jgi:hypothetical protein
VGGQGFGKWGRGVKEDSSCRLTSPENAVVKKPIPLLLERDTPSLTVDIEGFKRRLILDSGSSVSILPEGISCEDMRDTPLKPFGVTGEKLDVKGRQIVTFILVENRFKHNLLVCPLPSEVAGLLGADFLERVGANVNFESRELSFTHDKSESRARDDTHEGRMAHTVF